MFCFKEFENNTDLFSIQTFFLTFFPSLFVIDTFDWPAFRYNIFVFVCYSLHVLLFFKSKF